MKKVLASIIVVGLLTYAGAQTYPGRGSSIASGTTPVTCASGTTGVLYQSSGVVTCGTALTFDGVATLTVGTFAVSSPDGLSAIFGNHSTGAMYFDENTASPSFNFRGSGFATVLDWNATTANTWTFPSTTPVTMASATIKATALPASAGAGGLFVCVDTAGVLYKKATCP